MSQKIVRLSPYIKKEILIATLNKGLIREEKHQKSVPKKCLMCGEATTNPSGFCNAYVGSAFGCKEMWKEEYDFKPTKEDLDASWRNFTKSELKGSQKNQEVMRD